MWTIVWNAKKEAISAWQWKWEKLIRLSTAQEAEIQTTSIQRENNTRPHVSFMYILLVDVLNITARLIFRQNLLKFRYLYMKTMWNCVYLYIRKRFLAIFIVLLFLVCSRWLFTLCFMGSVSYGLSSTYNVSEKWRHHYIVLRVRKQNIIRVDSFRLSMRIDLYLWKFRMLFWENIRRQYNIFRSIQI